jgi:hypothetical protein
MSLRPRNTQSSDISAIEFKENRVVNKDHAVDVLRKEIASLKTQINSAVPVNNEAHIVEATDSLLKTDKKMNTGNHLHHTAAHCKAKAHTGRSMKHPMGVHKEMSHDLKNIQSSVLGKLDALENKIQSRSFVNADILSDTVVASKIELSEQTKRINEKLAILENTMKGNISTAATLPGRTSDADAVMVRVMNKLDALEQKVAQRKIEKSLPTFTHQDYLTEKERLNAMIQMRQKVC